MSDQRITSDDRINRRSTLKLIAGTGGLSLSTGAVSAVTALQDQRGSEADQIPESTIQTYGESLYEITTHPYLLTVSDEAIDRHFGASSIKGREYEYGRRYVERLRARYPVETVKDGYEERFELSDQARKNLNTERRSGKPVLDTADTNSDRPSPSEGGIPAKQSDHDQVALRTTLDVFGAQSSTDSNDSASPEWNRGHHVDLLDDAKDDVDTSTNFYTWARDPDDFSEWADGYLDMADAALDFITYPANAVPGVDWLQDKLLDGFSAALGVLLNNYTQYYDPNPITIPVPHLSDIKVGNIGMAPQACAVFYDMAETASSSYWTRKYTAWASHYLQDMANPLHTGMGMEQAGLDWNFNFEWRGGTRFVIDIDFFTSPKHWLHGGAEQLVSDVYEDELQGWYKGHETRWINSPEYAIDRIAQESNEYADDIFQTIMENETAGQNDPDEWSDDTRDLVTDRVESCLKICGKYNRQLLLDQGFGEKPSDPCPRCRTNE